VWLKANNPNYAKVAILQANLSQFLVDDNIADQLPIVEEALEREP
jgi:hypothetical protein